MSELVTLTLEISEEAATLARQLAIDSGRDVGDILSQWINRAAAEIPVDDLSDDQVLALCDTMMDDADQEDLSDLLADQREGLLTADQRSRLDGLMQSYRRGLVRKSEAMRVAVQRGLQASLI